MSPAELALNTVRAGVDRGTRRGDEADRHLADDLMSLYWQVIPLVGEPDLIREFFSTVPAEPIHFVGWSLFRTEKPVHPEPLARLRELWE
jgi:hypothetical protein